MVLKKRGAAASKKAKSLYCSFCGKDANSVGALIAGPTVFICEACVWLCNQILGGKAPPATAQVSSWDAYSDEDLLNLLARSSEIADAASESLGSHVDALRKREVSWAAIGKALGISRQAVWERFS